MTNKYLMEKMMENKSPDFFMVLGESPGLIQRLDCYRIKRYHANRRDDYLLIQVSPPVDGQRYGASHLINELIIAARHKGVSLFPIRKWPVEVYVLRTLVENPAKRDVLRDEDLALIDWATIYEPKFSM